MKLLSQVIPSGNATAVEIPKSAVEALRGGARPPVAVTINGHTWRTRVALMRGMCLIGISAQNRAAAGIAEGQVVEVLIELDEAPRDVAEPADLKAALDAQPALRSRFDALAFGLRQKHVRQIEEAKSAETRQRRVARLLAELQQQNAA